MSKIKEAISWVLFFFTPALAEKGSVLMYHSIGYNKKFSTVTPERFEEQLKYLVFNNYKTVLLSKLVANIVSKESIRGNVALTFDDGYKDFYTNAYPLLLKYKVPATVFIPTGFIGSTISVTQGQDTFPVLNLQEIKEMAKSGLVEFMPHTVSHRKLSKLETQEAIAEIEQSRTDVENIVGTQAPILAYPSGKYTAEIVDYLKESKRWFSAVTVNPGLIDKTSDLFCLNRNSIDSSVGLHQFRLKISGALETYIKIKTWLR